MANETREQKLKRAREVERRWNAQLAVVGNTYNVRDALKSNGCLWDRNRRVWLAPDAPTAARMQKLVDAQARGHRPRPQPFPAPQRKRVENEEPPEVTPDEMPDMEEVADAIGQGWPQAADGGEADGEASAPEGEAGEGAAAEGPANEADGEEQGDGGHPFQGQANQMAEDIGYKTATEGVSVGVPVDQLVELFARAGASLYMGGVDVQEILDKVIEGCERGKAEADALAEEQEQAEAMSDEEAEDVIAEREQAVDDLYGIYGTGKVNPDSLDL